MARCMTSFRSQDGGEPQTLQTLHDYAISLLARREYSASELRDRCARRTRDMALIEQVINVLKEEGLQSDERFTELFVRSRIARRHGVRRIVSELKLKGIGDTQARATLQSEATDWYALACEALAARFPSSNSDRKERARRQRFLAGRGFDGDQIFYALEHAWDKGGCE